MTKYEMNKQGLNLDKYKDKLSSALISDVLDEKGYCYQMLPLEIKPNFLDARIFGRARTMKLKVIAEGDNYKDVYMGLYFIEDMAPGEILVVANGFPNFAFFGELMSTLAKYRKVNGTIIDGCTRDYVETVKMEYPVFARNNFARDIKKRGIVDKLDVSVKIGEVVINKGDLLFGDYDGVVVIPSVVEEEVLEQCLKVIDLESKIKEDILNGISVKDLLNNRGEF
ncbi:MAG: RraA family protein [Candidatus Nanoarchaeia archaeon]